MQKQIITVIILTLIVAGGLVCRVNIDIVNAQSTSSIVVGGTVGSNLLSMGFQTDWGWNYLVQSSVVRQYALDINAKLVRSFDFRSTTPSIRPCTQWNEATKTGTWNWAGIDALTAAIFAVGAQPLYCLSWARDNIANYLPPGMAVNAATLLPYPASFAAYAAEWVRHFQQTGQPVRFYELFNEPYGYFTNGAHSFDENVGYFMQVWTAAAQAMRQINPNISLSNDQVVNMSVLQYWIANNGPAINSIDFHKYDTGTVPGRTDDDLFNRAETSLYSSAVTAQSYYATNKGVTVPIIDSESNMNSAWDGGTDPRLQQMSGGVWLALSLRTAMLDDVSYNIYYEFCNPKSSGKPTGGWGFGMIDAATNTRWIPYYVAQMFGKNLAVGDSIVQMTTADADLRAIGWKHSGVLNIVIINKDNDTKQISISGITGNLNYKKVDASTNVANPALQTGVYSVSNVQVHGYTVMLLTPSSTPPPPPPPPPPFAQLTVQIIGAGSTNVTGTNVYSIGTSITVAASPITGWIVDRWVLDGVNLGSSNYSVVVMNQNRNLTVVMIPNTPASTPTTWVLVVMVPLAIGVILYKRRRSE